MQFSRYLTYSNSQSIIRYWPWVLKGVLIIASFNYVISKLISEQSVFIELIDLYYSFQFVSIILLVTLLMALNWAVESIKWQLIANSFQQISFIKALKAILTGVSLDAILPFGTGAVGSKVLSCNAKDRNKYIGPIIITQAIQSIWTVIFGFIGINQLIKMTSLSSIYGSINQLIFPTVLVIVLLILIFKFWYTGIQRFIQNTKTLPKVIWFKITLLSLVRYLIFLVQLLLLSNYLSSELPLTILVGCSTWMFFAKTVVPKPGHLGAVGVRGASVVFFLTLAHLPSSGFVMATLVLWFINLAIPSLVGLFFMKDLNFSTEK